MEDGTEEISETPEGEGNTSQEETKATKPRGKLAAAEKEVARLKKVVQDRQSETSSLKAEFDEFKKQLERNQLSETEKQSADLKEAQEALAIRDRELGKLSQERAIIIKSSELVVKHGLRNVRHGKEIVEGYDIETHGDWDSYIDGLKKSDDFSYLFAKSGSVTNVTAPPMPGGTSGTADVRNRQVPKNLSDDDVQWARDRYPNDEDAQMRLLRRMAERA